VVIHEIIRTGVGSLFIEGYSIISWSPVLRTSSVAPTMNGSRST
jgi:hypothetical protein